MEYFDLIYIDAMKKEYLEYFLASLTIATAYAVFIIDDVEKFRDKMEDFYEWLHDNQIPYKIEKTDIDDSIMIIERKDVVL